MAGLGAALGLQWVMVKSSHRFWVHSGLNCPLSQLRVSIGKPTLQVRTQDIRLARSQQHRAGGAAEGTGPRESGGVAERAAGPQVWSVNGFGRSGLGERTKVRAISVYSHSKGLLPLCGLCRLVF